MAQKQEELEVIDDNEKYLIEIYIYGGDHQIVHIDFKPKGELRGLPPEEIQPILENIEKWEKLTGMAKELYNEITT